MTMQFPNPEPKWKPGDRANGYVLTEDGRWVPEVSAPPAPAAPTVSVTMVQQKTRTSHGLHLFLSIVTFGVWIPVWIIVTIVNRGK